MFFDGIQVTETCCNVIAPLVESFCLIFIGFALYLQGNSRLTVEHQTLCIPCKYKGNPMKIKQNDSTNGAIIWKPPWTDCNIQQHFAFGCAFCVSIVRMSFSRRNWVALLSTLSDFFREQKLTYKSWFFITFCAEKFVKWQHLGLHCICIDFALDLQAWLWEAVILPTSLHKKRCKIMISKLIFDL